MEEEGQPPALVLLRGDELLGQPGPLAFSLLCLHDQPRVLRRARCEVGEHGRSDEVPAVEAARAREAERADLVPPHCERDDHPVLGQPRLAGCVLGRREETGLARVEQPLGLVAGALDDLTRLERARDGGDGVDERLKEARLCLQLVLCRLVPAALGDDQVDRERTGQRCGQDETCGGQPEEPGCPADRPDDGRRDGGSRESARASSR
jgi:hypothetical protein